MSHRPLGALGPVTMVTTVLRVSDLTASVAWFRGRLKIEPVFVSPAEPLAVFPFAGTTLTLWALAAGATRHRADLEDTSYVVVVVDGDLDPIRHRLAAAGVEVTEVAPGADNVRFYFFDPDGNRFEVSRPAGRPADAQPAS